MVPSSIKQAIRKEKGNDYDIYKYNRPVTPKQVVSVFDLGYLGVEKDFPEQNHPYQTERRETKKTCLKWKKSATRTTLERG